MKKKVSKKVAKCSGNKQRSLWLTKPLRWYVVKLFLLLFYTNIPKKYTVEGKKKGETWSKHQVEKKRFIKTKWFSTGHIPRHDELDYID